MNRTQAPQNSPVLDLPNGTQLHLSSPEYLSCARFVVREIFHQRTYDHPGFELKPADVIVDVGAHVGVFAHWAAPQIPHGRLICVEPTSAADRLEHSLAANGLGNVSLHRCALGAPSSTLEMIDHPRFATLNRSSQFRPSPLVRFLVSRRQKKGDAAVAQVRQCPCESLEEILRRENVSRVDLLKVDCEGAEYAIIEHTSDSVLRRIDRIMMEFHVNHASHDLQALVTRLRQAGFSVEVEKQWLRYLFVKTGMLWATRRP